MEVVQPSAALASSNLGLQETWYHLPLSKLTLKTKHHLRNQLDLLTYLSLQPRVPNLIISPSIMGCAAGFSGQIYLGDDWLILGLEPQFSSFDRKPSSIEGIGPVMKPSTSTY